MKWLAIIFVLCLPLVVAHGNAQSAQAGVYTVELITFPEQLEPGQTQLVVHVLDGETPVPDKHVWLRLTDDKKTYLAGTFVTDQLGSITLSYLFNGPGEYELAADVEGSRALFEVHVHGQYMLLFGFLAAVFIVVALLLEKI